MQLRAIILNNVWLKFWSIALATVVWMAIHYSIEHDFGLKESDVKHLVPQKYENVRVEVITPPDDRRVFKVSPRRVSVVALGEESILHAVTTKDILVHADLSEFTGPRPTEIELHADAPRSMTILAIVPSTVTVEQVTK
jgi:hypothetical protein